jgi:nitrogen fixation protein FixH
MNLRKTIFPALLAVFALLFTFACSNANAPETAKAAGQAASASQTTGVAPLKIDLKTDPTEPSPNKPAKFNVTITDRDGKPVTGADVNIALTMKTMDMGEEKVKLADKGTGEYQGEGKVTMAGDWNAAVTAKKGSQTAVQSFPVKSVMPKP